MRALSARASRPDISRPQNRQNTFLTEVTEARRHSISARATRPVIPSGPGRPVRKVFVPKLRIPPVPKPEEQGYYDQNTLVQHYEQLYAQISLLKKEIEPLRDQYLKLKDELLFQNRCANSSEIDFAYYAPALAEAIGNGPFSSAIKEFAWKSFENMDEMSQLRNQLSFYAVVRLAIEVDDARQELADMRKDIDNMKNQEQQCRSRLEQSRNCFPRGRIEGQLETIRDLQVTIARYEIKNQRYEQKIDELEKQTQGMSSEQLEEFDEIEKLTKELNDKRQQYYAKCNELIDMRKQQMREIEELGAEKSKEPFPRFEPTEPVEQRQSGRRFSRPEISYAGPVAEEVIKFGG